MTTDRELMQQALDALFNLRWAASERDKKNRIRQFDEFMDGSDEAIEALRARLAQPEPEVRWDASAPLVVQPHPAFQATQQQREWQRLTEKDVVENALQDTFPAAFGRGAKWADEKLKEKNAL